MIDLTNFLYDRIKAKMENWTEEGIFALSFLIYKDEASDLPYFAISYNTEEHCQHASPMSKKRWDYNYWPHNEEEILIDKEATNTLIKWYQENNITDIGYEDIESMYDDEGNYIGKGPNGFYELFQVASEVAKKLHKEQVIKNIFKKELPIIIHGLEFTWYAEEATKNGNPNGEAKVFLDAYKNHFPE